MSLLLQIVLLAGALCLFFVFLYVFGTYLLFNYDRRLGRAGLLSPQSVQRDDFPTRWARRQGFFKELLSTFAFVWLYPLGWIFRHPWKLAGSQGSPMILIHGYNHNQSAWACLRYRLKRGGVGPIYSLNLQPRYESIEEFAQQVKLLAEQIEKETGATQLVLAGHSMGGLVAAYYAQELAPPRKVTHVIMIGSPLQGTRLALMAGSSCVKQMRPESALLASLHQGICADPRRYYAIASQFDNVIFPYQSGLTGIDLNHQKILSREGHLSLLFSRAVAKQMIDWLHIGVPLLTKHKDSQKIALPSGNSPAYRIQSTDFQ